MQKYRMEKIGYVAGIKYNSEGKIIDWLYGKRGLMGYGGKLHIFNTETGAKRHLKKMEPHIGEPYIREMFREIKLSD